MLLSVPSARHMLGAACARIYANGSGVAQLMKHITHSMHAAAFMVPENRDVQWQPT